MAPGYSLLPVPILSSLSVIAVIRGGCHARSAACAVSLMQVLLATCAAQAGDEALVKYSNNSNASFLAMYGFVPERNPCAALELFEDVHEAATWAVASCPPPVRPSSTHE